MSAAADGFRMPAEWAPHERTWMAWPGPNTTFDDPDDLLASRMAWASVARAVLRFEPVTVVCGPGNIEQAHQPNEWVSIEQLARFEAFMERLAERLCA